MVLNARFWLKVIFLKPGCKQAFNQRNAGEPSLQPHVIPDVGRNVNPSINFCNPKFGDKVVNKHLNSHDHNTPFAFQSYPFCILKIVLNNNNILPFTSFMVMNAHSKQPATALNYNEKGRERWMGISGLKTEYSIRYTVSSRGQRALYYKLYSEGMHFPPL